MVHIDRDLWRERQRQSRNGNGNGDGNGKHKWPWSSIPSILAVTITFVSQGVFMVWWVRGESARIDANQAALAHLQEAIYSMNTPLSTRVVRMEGRIEDMIPIVRNNFERTQKLEHDISVLSERQQNITRRLDTMTGMMEKGFRLQGEGRPEPPR